MYDSFVNTEEKHVGDLKIKKHPNSLNTLQTSQWKLSKAIRNNLRKPKNTNH